MRLRVTALALVAAGCLAAPALAQQKPNFTGNWVIVSPEQGAGQEQIIKHDEKTLTIARSADPGSRTLVHQLDGAEHKTTIPMRGGEVVMISKAVWEGATLVITTATSYPNKMKTESKEVWSIDDQGRLVIDYMETAEGQKPRTFKVIQTKKH